MKERIYQYIQEIQGVTYAELARNIEGFAGGLQVGLPGNIVLWSDISEAGDAAIAELLNEKRIIGAGCSVLCYVMDGRVIDLPLARRLKPGYRTPHWWPITFSTVEHHDKKNARRK